VKYTPEIAKKRSIFHGTSNSLPMVADPGGLSLLKKIKIVSPSKKYTPKKSKKRSIFYHPLNSLHDRVTNHGPRGPKKKLVYPRDKI
jgi:hypothetical protein